MRSEISMAYSLGELDESAVGGTRTKPLAITGNFHTRYKDLSAISVSIMSELNRQFVTVT